jgi:RecB family exonuclease
MLSCNLEVERPFLKIVANASPAVLEAELLDRVAAAKSTEPLAPVLVVVPSRRLADHVAGSLVRRFGAVLGVSVLHHRALAEQILERAGDAPRHVLGDELAETLFANVVRRAPAGPVRDFVRDHPGAGGAMHKALTDLREAGIEPAAAIDALTGPEAETAILYSRWSAALDELATARGALDDAGLAGAAIPEAAAFASGFTTILHHGAYDLIGVRVELVRALDRGCPVTFLLPADPVAESGAFGVDRARAFASPRVPPSALARELAKPAVSFLHAQGAEAELKTAVYEALAAVEAGTPPHDAAIVVRSWGPYTSAMDALLDGDGPRWHTSLTRPLRREAAVAKAMRAIAAGEDRGPAAWTDHADAFAATALAFAPHPKLPQIFESMRQLESILGDDRTVARGEALSWLDARVDAASIAPEQGDGGGVRILDAMQARGLTFSHLTLAGMNTGVFPRVARDHPFLSDDARARLREATGRPLPLARESDAEERLLLAMMLGAARERIHVSWLRADDAARPLVPSTALATIARFAVAGPDAADAEREARVLPAHPRARLQAWATLPGLLNRRDEAVLAALASELGADAGPAVVERSPDWSDGVTLVAATEAFDRAPGRYDGRLGTSVLRSSMPATALERLGRCPLQFFFRDVLRIQPLRRPPTPFSAEAASIGSRVHDVLRSVYQRLGDEHAFTALDLDARTARARSLLKEAWAEPADADAIARARRFPVLDGIETGIWVRSLASFLDADLKRLESAGLVPEALESDAAGAILGDPDGLAITTRFDRVCRGEAGRVVGDYKTGVNLAERAKPAKMLTGETLQVPIYALVADAPVELLGVGPRHDASDASVARFEGWKTAEQREGVVETLRVAASLAGQGRFPIHAGDHCAWCDFRSACRHAHPPTAHRESGAQDVTDVRDCWRKTAKAPTLAALRREDAP